MNWLTTILKALGAVLGVVLAVVGVAIALKLSLASFPKRQVLLVVGGGMALLLLVFLPVWQVRNLSVDCTEDGQRKVELENEARKTIAQILGGAAVLAGVFFTAQQLFVAQDAQRVAEEAQITERFTRATEQLGSRRMHGRPKCFSLGEARHHWLVFVVRSVLGVPHQSATLSCPSKL